MSVLRAFPRRPLKLLRAPSGRVGIGQVLGLLFFIGALVGDGFYYGSSIYDDVMLGQSGTPAQDVHLTKGKCSSKAFIYSCDIDISYRTADRTARQASLHYLTAFQKVDDHMPLAARYDPANPARVSASWGVQLLTNRIVSNLALVTLVLLLIGGFAVSYRESLRLRKSLVAMARDPRPVIARFVGVRTSKKFSTVRFDWTDPSSWHTRRDSSRLAGTAQPFWLDRERTAMLALAGPDGHAHLLDEDLSQVELTEDERTRIWNAVRAGAAAA
jgi:hypothetical protein